MILTYFTQTHFSSQTNLWSGSPRHDLQFGYVKVKQVQKFNYMVNVITGILKCDLEIRGGIGIVKDTCHSFTRK